MFLAGRVVGRDRRDLTLVADAGGEPLADVLTPAGRCAASATVNQEERNAELFRLAAPLPAR